MVARVRSWWQNIKQRRVTILVVAIILIIAVALIIVVAWFYGTGFNGYNQVTIAHTISGPSTGTVVRTEVSQPGKTLWDWLQLLIIPFALAIIAIFFNRSERKNEQRIASDNQQESALQDYIKEISELLLEKHLGELKPEYEAVRKIARVRTLTVLPRLDGKRKRNLLLFLYDAGLIDRKHQIIDVSDADFSEADLSEVSLFRYKLIRKGESQSLTTVNADLSGVNLRNANLNEANLRGVKLGAEDELHLEISDKGYSTQGTNRADLSGAKLVKAKLCEAALCGVNLSKADLRGADLSIQILEEELDDFRRPTGYK